MEVDEESLKEWESNVVDKYDVGYYIRCVEGGLMWGEELEVVYIYIEFEN